MSSRPTIISEDIFGYLKENFSSEDEFLANLTKEATKSGIPEICISAEQGRFLQFFLRAISAKNVLEIGGLAGYSAITMARALPSDGKVYSVEIDKRNAEFMRRKIAQAGLSEKIEVINEDAHEFTANWKPDFELDFVFIDADKRWYDFYMKKCTPLLRKGGIICADNALAFGFIVGDGPEHDRKNVQAIRDFNQKLRSNEQYFSCIATLGDGMAMGVKL
jgi:predicted O-methyltransferase YrrM